MVQLSKIQLGLKILLGLFMLFAGIGHLTFARSEFLAQVPDWVPMNKDLVVVLSGVVEVMFGLAMIFVIRKAAYVGMLLALFYVAVFPGNIAQYVRGDDAFGLDSDAARFARLFFQPVLILWALWSTGFFNWWKERRSR